MYGSVQWLHLMVHCPIHPNRLLVQVQWKIHNADDDDYYYDNDENDDTDDDDGDDDPA